MFFWLPDLCMPSPSVTQVAFRHIGRYIAAAGGSIGYQLSIEW